jgi:Zn-dependent protease with chaperone function
MIYFMASKRVNVLLINFHVLMACKFILWFISSKIWDSLFGTVNGLCSGCLGFSYRHGNRLFSYQKWPTGCGTYLASCSVSAWVSLPRDKAVKARSWQPKVYLVPSLRASGAEPPLDIYSFIVCIETTLLSSLFYSWFFVSSWKQIGILHWCFDYDVRESSIGSM